MEKNLEEFVSIFNTRKDHVVHFLKKHFIENKDYVKVKPNINKSFARNKTDYFVTHETFEMIRNISWFQKMAYVKILSVIING